MGSRPLAASSSTTGFFQALPTLPPQYTISSSQTSSSHSQPVKTATQLSDDKVLARILSLYISPNASHVTSHVHRLARIALHPSVLKHATDAETNHPVLRPLTTFGEENKNDPLWTTTGWQRLKEISYKEGVVAVAYEKEHTGFNRRIYQFALDHVWGSTGTMTGCPGAMQDGAATLLSKHLGDEDGDQPGREKVLEEAYRRLTSRDPETAWTSGQWMTERTGGSDVSETETVAKRLTSEELQTESTNGREFDAIGMPLGPWRIDGFKWFSSATDSEMAVLLARTSKGGLSAFYAPMRRRTSAPTGALNNLVDDTPPTELNGIRIQRLKNKLGTKSLPTAELELKGTRAWLIGAEGQGVKEISAILNITRLHTAAGSAGGWARGLAIARAYTKVRKVHARLLQDDPVHLKWMADETVKYWAGTHFAFFGVALQGAVEQEWSEMVANTKAGKLIPNDKKTVQTLLRLLTPVMKAQVSVASVHGLRQCMECLGGVGYCENNEDGGLLNIAKVYRDTLVNPIWEGTVSVMADDVVRVLLDKRLGNGDVLQKVFAPWVQGVVQTCSSEFEGEIRLVEERLKALVDLARSAKKEELLYRGREILEHIEAITCSCLLMYDATVSPDEVAVAVASRWTRSRALQYHEMQSPEPWQQRTLLDKRIFLGADSARVPRQGKL